VAGSSPLGAFFGSCSPGPVDAANAVRERSAHLRGPVGWKGRACLYRPRSKNDLPVWPWPSGNQIFRIGVIGLGLTRRLSHNRGKVPLEGYSTIARRG
jgi:hypothetical protein